jgi:membrane protease YdiL (CAAX protease family)
MSRPAGQVRAGRTSVGESRTRDSGMSVIVSLAPAVGGVGLLLLRPALTGGARWSAPALTAVYVAILGLSLGAVALARVETASSSPAPRPAGRAPSLGSLPVLILGAAAVLVARLATGTAPQLPSGTLALGFTTLAAVAEEALFRGAMYGRLERLGAAPAIAGSAVAFALIHIPGYGLPALPVDLGAGLLFGWQRWASGRWTVPAATHAAANLLAVMR